MKNKFYLLLSLILSTFLFAGNIKADTSVDYSMSINYGNPDNRTIIGGFYYLPSSNIADSDLVTWFKVSPENKILYCSDGKGGSLAVDSGTFYWNQNCIRITGDRSRSLAYVYENGYNTYTKDCSATDYLMGSYDQDYFITQTAAWYFTTKPGWMSNFNVNTGEFFGTANDFSKKISKLITDAAAAGKEGPKLNIGLSNSKMTLTSDGKYYISSAITLSGKYLNSNITTSLTGASGAFVNTSKDAKSGMNSFANGSTVYIKVPVDSINSSTTINLSISATSALAEGNIIQCDYSNETMNIQSMIEYTPSNTTLTAGTSVTISKVPVTISKQDITTSKEVAGAKLSLKNGTIEIDSWTSGTEAHTVNLDSGTYTLTETIAPEGYRKKTTSIVFTVKEDGKIYVDGKEVSKVIMTNELITVSISKRSITGSEELPGAKLRILDNDGNVAKDINDNLLEWTSSTEAKTYNLAAGTYTLIETIAPEGYELSETTIEFTISDEGKVLVDGQEVEDNLIIFKNTPEAKSVPTGNAILYSIIAIGVVSLGISIYFIIRKYKK